MCMLFEVAFPQQKIIKTIFQYNILKVESFGYCTWEMYVFTSYLCGGFISTNDLIFISQTLTAFMIVVYLSLHIWYREDKSIFCDGILALIW